MPLTMDIPRIGWRWVRCFDAGDSRQQCEVCASEATNILHFVRHREYPDGRFVGSRCAGALLKGQDARDASDAERAVRQRALSHHRLRNGQVAKVNWSVTPDGHDTAKLGTTRVVISQSASRAWAIAIIVEDDENWTFAPGIFRYREDAMEAAATLLLDRKKSRERRDHIPVVLKLEEATKRLA